MELVYTFDPERFYLGTLCKRGHKWPGTEQSLRRTFIDRRGKNCSQCVGCTGAKTKDWLLSFVDTAAMGFAKGEMLGPVCKNGHLWQGHQITLRVKGKCPQCQRTRNQRLTEEQLQAKRARARARYAEQPYDPELQRQKNQAARERLRNDPERFARYLERKRQYKGACRRARGYVPQELRALRKAIREAGRLPNVIRLVANEQRRYWRENPEAKRQARAEWHRNQWQINYLTNLELRLYTREKSRRRKLQQRKQAVWKISVLQLRTRFLRFNNACAYCGSTAEIQIEHVLPISKGGLHHINNIVPACKACNYSKAAHPMDQWYRSQSFFDPGRLALIQALTGPPDAEQLNLGLAS